MNYKKFLNVEIFLIVLLNLNVNKLFLSAIKKTKIKRFIYFLKDSFNFKMSV